LLRERPAVIFTNCLSVNILTNPHWPSPAVPFNRRGIPVMRVLPLAAAVAGVLLASSAHAQVVISQVYGGGGNTGATLKSDFIELHNNGTSAVDLNGWTIQYAASAGTSWQTTALSGSIAAGGYYLIKQADGSGGSVALPTPDAIGTIAMA